jgi:hypothetical protein
MPFDLKKTPFVSLKMRSLSQAHIFLLPCRPQVQFVTEECGMEKKFRRRTARGVGESE